MSFDPASWTYGVELEMADVDRHAVVPQGSWNTKDYTIVNSNGVANDPLGTLWRWGGELNTFPNATVEEQAELCRRVFETLKPTINYRCNLHIHVRVPGLRDDLIALKRVQACAWEQLPALFPLIEPIPKPTGADTREALAGAMKRYRRRFRSHQFMLPPARHGAVMAAKTPLEFYRAHAYPDKRGRPQFHLMPRAAVNLRQVFEETNTVEFRHFPGTSDPAEVLTALSWCREFLDAALNTGQRLADVLAANRWMRFPVFQTYRHELETVYQLTNLEKNSRAVVAERLKAMGLI